MLVDRPDAYATLRAARARAKMSTKTLHAFLSARHDIILFSDTYIQKAKKTYQDSRSRRNLNTLNTELHDVQRIMVQNIDDVLQRGAVLSGKTIW